METYIIEPGDEIPDWLRHYSRELAWQYLESEDPEPVVLAKRKDGAVQVVPQGHLDAEVIAELMKWAAAL